MTLTVTRVCGQRLADLRAHGLSWKTPSPCAAPSWGNCFRAGNAVGKFIQAGQYVAGRLRGLMVNKRAATCVPDRPTGGHASGSRDTASTASAVPSAIRRCSHAKKIIGRPYAGTRAHGLKGGMGSGPTRAPRP